MIYKNVGDNSQQGETATVSEQDVFSAAQTDGHSSAAAINSDQSKNLPADIGRGAIDIQGPVERIPENPTGEGVKNESLIPTESFSGATKPAAEKLDHLESPHGKSTGTTALHDSPIQALRAAAECGQNIMSGSSFVAGKEVASLGDSSETTSRCHMETGHTQQQPLKTSDIQKHPSPSNEQQHPQGDRQQCLNAEAILDNNRAEGFQLQLARSAPGGIDSNGSSQVFRNRRGRDDPTPQTNDQSTKMLEGGIEVSL